MVKPGVRPSLLPWMIVHGPGTGPCVVQPPVSSSSADRVRLPTRLVNQLESGTSSIVFRFCARRSSGSLLGSPALLA